MRALAQKYNINITTIANKSRSENWVELRKQNTNKTQTKTVDKIIEKTSEQTADGLTRCNDLANRLLDKIETAIDELDSREMGITTQEKKYAEDENGIEVELTTKTENLYIKKATVQTQKMKQLTAALRDVRDILTGDEGSKDNTINLIISKDEFDDYSY